MVHNFGTLFLCFVCFAGILSVIGRVESREISISSSNSVIGNNNGRDDEELEELINNGGEAEVELSGSERFKKSVMGLFGLVTQKPHHKTETEMAFPPPQGFLSTRGKKFYGGSGFGSGRSLKHDMSLIPVPVSSDFRLGFPGDGDWSWKIPAEQFLFSRGRVRGVNPDYIQNF